jgi:hypothetical protein
MKRVILGVVSLIMFFALQTCTFAQLLMPYTIQGSLRDNGVPANGNYDISYNLYDTDTSTIIIGGNNHINVPVVNGIFTFTETADAVRNFPGRTMWIEFGFKPAFSQVEYTTVSPRQRLGAVPYAVSSLISADSQRLGGTDAAQFVQTGDPRLTDPRPPTAGSGNYVQNRTTAQFNTNFNISGTGTADVLSAQTSYGLDGTTIIRSMGRPDTLLIGDRAGISMSVSASNNTMVGSTAGFSTSTGRDNSFFGSGAGSSNQTASGNSYFGRQAGHNRTGNFNSVFGSASGLSSLLKTGDFNSFLGHRAGESTTGNLNSFVGTGAGFSNGSGSSNTFLGHNSGDANVDGSFNNTLGEFANVGAPNLTNATAIGTRALVSQSNSIVIGSINNVNGATSDTNVGIGTTTPNAKLHVNGTVRVTNGGIVIANPNTLFITSPNGACWGITVNNSGALATFPVTPCP